MSDDSILSAPVSFDDAWAVLADQSYALPDEREVGLSEKFRVTLLQRYFNDSVLRHDEGDWPVDYKGARDVIRYQWSGDGLRPQEHETITIADCEGIPGKRDHSRGRLLRDPAAEKLVSSFLSLMSPAQQQRDGRFSINILRTFTNVMTFPQNGREKFIKIYVVDRVGEDAASYFYLLGDARSFPLGTGACAFTDVDF